MAAKCIMVQGTMSGAGKSLLCAALCRIFMQDGYRVAPFKSQNMALNSYITDDGLEMGRAQAVQAFASGKSPDVRMNPILLKPSSDTGSQVIVNGEVLGDYRAADYFKMKKSLIPDIMKAYNSLAEENDIIVIEGAGSPAEINLKSDDIVNMGLAKLVNAPVILAGNIDPGGVFAQLYGTIALLEKDEQDRIIGTLINKFRGDVDILRPGLSLLEDKCGRPCLGVIPYADVDIDDEDSLAPCLSVTDVHRDIDIAVIRLPKISNFTDFAPLERHPSLGVRYVKSPEMLGAPDMIIIPGSKNTMGDLEWLRDSGLADKITSLSVSGTPVLGVCGGFQMMGELISDPENTEHGGEMAGLGLLPCKTVFEKKKVRTKVHGKVCADAFNGAEVDGYEIHMGRTARRGAEPFTVFPDGHDEGACFGSCYGTYLHGLFDSGKLTARLAEMLLEKKGIKSEEYVPESHRDYQEKQYDILADIVRKNIDLEYIYGKMEEYAK